MCPCPCPYPSQPDIFTRTRGLGPDSNVQRSEGTGWTAGQTAAQLLGKTGVTGLRFFRWGTSHLREGRTQGDSGRWSPGTLERKTPHNCLDRGFCSPAGQPNRGGGRLVKDTDAPPLSTQPHHVPLYLKPTPAPRNLMPPLLWLLMRPPGLPLPTPPNPHHPTLLLLLRLCPGLCSPFHPQSLGLRALSSFLFSPGWAPTGAD